MFDKNYYDSIWQGVHRHDYVPGLADQLIAKYNPKSVLDIGTGCGYLIEVLRGRGIEAYGLEISPYACENSHGNVLLGSVTDIPFKDGQFDLVHSQGLWEYVAEENIAKAWSECLRMGRAQEHNIDTLTDQAEWSKDFATHKSSEWWAEKLKIRLNLGCGNFHLEGYTNIDILCPEAINFDLRQLLWLADATVDEIYAAHIIEHFSRDEWAKVKQDWIRALKSGGKLTVGCPNFDKCLREYQAEPTNEYWFKTIYGSQVDEYDFHKNGFNKENLISELNAFRHFEILKDTAADMEITCLKS